MNETTQSKDVRITTLEAAVRKVFGEVKADTVYFTYEDEEEIDMSAMDLAAYGIRNMELQYNHENEEEGIPKHVYITVDVTLPRNSDWLVPFYRNIAATMRVLSAENLLRYRRESENWVPPLYLDVPVRREGDLERVLTSVKRVGEMQRAYETMEETP